jgi:hypothetical protein
MTREGWTVLSGDSAIPGVVRRVSVTMVTEGFRRTTRGKNSCTLGNKRAHVNNLPKTIEVSSARDEA